MATTSASPAPLDSLGLVDPLSRKSPFSAQYEAWNAHKIGTQPRPRRPYQLDHIVPISTCWEYNVPEVGAGDVRNLQVIPWVPTRCRRSRRNGL
jgi:hypothetical protein